MMMVNIPRQKLDLSHINSLEDIDLEIRKVKRRIRQREIDLKEGFKAIPKEAVKSSMGNVMPLFKKEKTADSTINTIQTVIGGLVAAIIAGKKTGGGFKKGLGIVIKQLGVVETTKLLIKLFSKKDATDA